MLETQTEVGVRKDFSSEEDLALKSSNHKTSMRSKNTFLCSHETRYLLSPALSFSCICDSPLSTLITQVGRKGSFLH